MSSITPRRREKIECVARNRRLDITMVLVDIHDPHNVAAILRTCDAFGIQNVHLVFEQEKPYNPLRVGKSSSSSANKWLTFHKHTSVLDCYKELHKNNFTIVATALDMNATKLCVADLSRGNIAIVIGNEHAGLSEEAIINADMTIYITMNGMVQSLNVSVTAGICLFELCRQKQHAGSAKNLSENEYKATLNDLLSR